MRKLFVLFAVGALACAVAAATAFAAQQPNTVNYTVKAKAKGKASKKKPAPLSYRGILAVKTTNNTQPNVAPTTELFFPKQLVQMSKYFPHCDGSKLDGQSSVPASCKKAVVGKGTAKASGGAPGQPLNPATTEALSVTAYNGKKNQLLLVVNGSSPLQISNRVITGKLGPGSGKFGYTVTFTVPADLQYQLGLQVALTDFDVTLPSKTRTVKIKGKKTKVSYLMAKKCGTLPTKTTVNFDQDGAPGGPGTGPTTPVTVTGSMKC